MRKACLIITLVFMVFAAKAQDIITLTNGAQIQAKVLQINPDNVVYKDYNNLDGPTITVLKAGVTSIQYVNGTKTTFTDAVRPNTTPGNFTRSSSDHNNDNNNKATGYRRRSEKNNKVKGWYFGVNLALGISNASSKDVTISTSAGGYSAENILATKMFNQHVGIQFGLGAESYAYNVAFTDYSQYAGQTDIFSISCITIPVKVLYFSNSKKKIGFYTVAGFDFSFVGGARDQEQDDLSNYYNSTIISPYISCGVDIRNRSARGIWMFGPYYKTALTNCYSNKSGDNGALSSFGLSITYMAKFGRR